MVHNNDNKTQIPSVFEKLEALDKARKLLEIRLSAKRELTNSLENVIGLDRTYFYRLADHLKVSPNDLKTMIMWGMERAVKEAGEKVTEAEKSIENLLR